MDHNIYIQQMEHKFKGINADMHITCSIFMCYVVCCFKLEKKKIQKYMLNR